MVAWGRGGDGRGSAGRRPAGRRSRGGGVERRKQKAAMACGVQTAGRRGEGDVRLGWDARRNSARGGISNTPKLLWYWQYYGFRYRVLDGPSKHLLPKNTIVFPNTIVLLKNCENTVVPNRP